MLLLDQADQASLNSTENGIKVLGHRFLHSLLSNSVNKLAQHQYLEIGSWWAVQRFGCN